MISNPAVRRISFTGSTEVGRIVGERRAVISSERCSSWGARIH